MKTIIRNLSHDGRGVGDLNGKTVFIDNALPGEMVEFTLLKKHKTFDEGMAQHILTPSPDRVFPKCPHYGVCGGCSQQHLVSHQQIAYKQKTLLEQLQHFANITPQHVLPPITGPQWGYRYKARIGVRFIKKKSRLLIGFREKRNHLIADLNQCDILLPAIGEHLSDIRTLIARLKVYEFIPQIEVAAGDQEVALVIRHLTALPETDIELLKTFGQQHQFHLYLQPGSPSTVHKIWPEESSLLLTYTLPHQQLKLQFHPLDFTQINPAINRQLVDKALELLSLTPTDQVLDLFCGLGNFTLPIATLAKHVTGVEGGVEMVQRAKDNARFNQLTNVDFFAWDLSKDITGLPWAMQSYTKILLDPPRTGAGVLIPQLKRFRASKIVYISCNPATLARDAKLLTHELGYQLTHAGVIDMFPHTDHVESIAVFAL